MLSFVGCKRQDLQPLMQAPRRNPHWSLRSVQALFDGDVQVETFSWSYGPSALFLQKTALHTIGISANEVEVVALAARGHGRGTQWKHSQRPGTKTRSGKL